MGYENSAGLGVVNHYGPRDVDSSFGGKIPGGGIVKELEYVFDFDNLPTGQTNDLGVSLPARTKIVSAKMEILTGFTSTSTTTDLTVGLEQADGTDIDVDGLIAAAEATQTAIGTAGNFVTGAGALIGASIGANAGELIVAPTVDDLLTGKARVIVEYIEEGV